MHLRYMKNTCNKLIYTLIIFCVFFCLSNTAHAAETKDFIPTPNVIYETINNQDWQKPTLHGESILDTSIHVFIDETFAGQTFVNKEGKFSFTPAQIFVPGSYSITAQSIDKFGKKSNLSEIYTLIIEYKLPSPTIQVLPTQSDKTWQYPTFTGETTPSVTLHVYIDGILDGTKDIERMAKYSIDYSYTTYKKYTEGTHKVYVIGITDKGVESFPSEVRFFSLENPGTMPHEPSTTPDDPVIVVESAIDTPSTIISETEQEISNIQDIILQDALDNIIVAPPTSTEEKTPKITAITTEETITDYSVTILIILTIVVIAFLLWFIWTNKDFFTTTSQDLKEKESQPKKEKKLKKTEENTKEPPSLF